jgi:hypothetical protein
MGQLTFGIPEAKLDIKRVLRRFPHRTRFAGNLLTRGPRASRARRGRAHRLKGACFTLDMTRCEDVGTPREEVGARTSAIRKRSDLGRDAFSGGATTMQGRKLYQMVQSREAAPRQASHGALPVVYRGKVV